MAVVSIQVGVGGWLMLCGLGTELMCTRAAFKDKFDSYVEDFIFGQARLALCSLLSVV